MALRKKVSKMKEAYSKKSPNEEVSKMSRLSQSPMKKGKGKK